MNDAKSLQQAQRRDGGVKIQAGRKSGPKRQTERLQQVHLYIVTPRSKASGSQLLSYTHVTAFEALRAQSHGLSKRASLLQLLLHSCPALPRGLFRSRCAVPV